MIFCCCLFWFFFFCFLLFFTVFSSFLRSLAFMNELHWLKLLKLNSFAGAVCAHLFIYSGEKACSVQLLLLQFCIIFVMCFFAIFCIFCFEVSHFLRKKLHFFAFLLLFRLLSSSIFSLRYEFSHFKHGNPPHLLEFKEFSSSMSTARSLKLAIWDFIFLLLAAPCSTLSS